MAQKATKRKKKAESIDVRALINQMLDDAMKSRNQFTDKQYASFEKAREERRMQNMIAMRPSRMPSHIKTTRKEEDIEIQPPMTREGYTKSLDMGDALDLSEPGKRGRIRKWAIG